MAENLTPMFRQYRGIKKQYPDVILLFRLGDFYEMFEEDALIASSELELVLTGRGDGAKGERVPMCGIPFHAVDRYVARLIAKGHRVAICDQVEDPAFAKGLVNRQVTRVVTPGTVVEDAMLEAKANNYLVSLAFADAPGRAGATGRRGDGAKGLYGRPGRAEPVADPESTPEEPSSSDLAPPAPGSLQQGPPREERPPPAVPPSGIGLAVCDLSTGEFAVTEFHGAEAARAAGEELARLAPAELVVPEAAVERATALTQSAPVPITPLKRETFARRGARETLLRHFEVQSLHGFGCEEMPLAIEAAAGVLTYLRETKLPAVEHIRSLATYTTSGFMALDATARRNLELTQTMWDGSRSRTLLSILDATCTAMGGRLLRKWLERPLVDVGTINQRLDAVEELTRSALLRGELREALGRIADLERLVSRCATGTANARDLVAFRASLLALPPLVEALAGVHSARLCDVCARLDPLAELVDLLARAIEDEPPISLREGGIIRDGFSEQLDLHRREAREGKEWIANLEATERERTGIKSLKVGYNDVFKFYIEVTKPNLAYVPDNYIPRQTTTNAQRYVTAELKEQESRILGAEKRMFELEYGLFGKVREKVGREAGRVLATAAAVAELDALASHAETAVRHGYTRPVVDAGSILHVRNGRHPVVERLGQEPFVPNDVLMDEETNRLLVITGPNMSGKCLSKHTLIFTNRGLTPIVELMPPDAQAGEFAEIDCEVYGRTGRRRATHFYRGGWQRTLKITTRLGYEIEGTPEHRVWVRNLDGREGWKLLGDLSEGDVVALKRGPDLWGNVTRIHASVGELVPWARRYHLPEELDENLAYLMGLLIGDGTLTYGNSFLLTTADSFLAEEFRRIIDRLFGCPVSSRRDGVELSVRSKQLRLYLAGLGLGYHHSYEKHVPHTILRAPRRIVIAFLQGLFDTDGFAENRYGNVHLATSSARLAREVQLLLLNLGMVASLHVKKTARRPSHQIAINGADAITFHREVGFRLPRKQSRSALASEIRMPNIGGIPYLNGTLKQVQASIVATQNKPVALKHNKRINSIFYTYVPNGRNISHAKLGELVTYCHESGVACAELERLQRDHFFYDRIAEIEPGEAEVYDLSVEQDHSYVAAGFVSHNSTYLRQVALITLMAQAGSMVPADGAQIGVVDRIFTRVGAHDDLASGQSTFMVEMNETANILNNATSRSLVILDEIGRGTSTYDGLSIAWAVAEYLQQVGAKTLFATHYHHLNDLADRLPGVKNYRIAVREDGHRIVWLRKIVPGGTDKSYGIQVGRLAGLPDSVIQRAREVLEDLERGNRNGAGVPSEQTRVPVQKQRLQLTLFEAEEHPILDALRRLDLTTITPIEALTRLHELQKQIEKKR